MNFLKITLLSFLSLVLFFSQAEALITTGDVTGGSVVGDGGVFVQLFPSIGDVGEDYQQSSNLFGFDELQDFILTAPLNLNMGTSLILPIGTEVSSHFVMFDPRGIETLEGYVEFDEDILGVITKRSDLIASHYLGDPTAIYHNPIFVSPEPADFVSISGTRRLSLDIWAFTPGDYIRVITKGSSNATVPEPATMTLMGLGLAGLMRFRKRT